MKVPPPAVTCVLIRIDRASRVTGPTNGTGNVDIDNDLKLLLEKAESLVPNAVGDPSSDADCSSGSEHSIIQEPLSRDASIVIAGLSRAIDNFMDFLPTLEAEYDLKHSRSAHNAPLEALTLTSSAIPYANVVRDKFPKAASALVDRLGEANWQRHEKLRLGLPGDKAAMELAQMIPAKTLFQPVSLFKDSALGSSIHTPTEREGSVASHRSLLSSVAGDSISGLRVPPIPDGRGWGESFECPYCHEEIEMTSRVAWK
jgi:hypothetical protein